MSCSVDVDEEAATIIEPNNHKEAVSDPDYGVEWVKAEKEEVKNMLSNKTFREVRIADLPMGTRIVSGRWVFKVKPAPDGKVSVFKARIVARGNETKPGVHYDDTFAPVACSTTIKLLLAIATTLGLRLRSVDFKSAFLHAVRGKDQKNIYMRPPPGAGCPPGKVWLILKALYGLADSPLLWHKTLVDFLKTLGYKQSSHDPCLMYKVTSDTFTILTMIVDDILIASKQKAHADELVKALSAKFRTKDLGKPEYIIGLHIKHDQEKSELLLNQELYLKTIAKRFGVDKSKPVGMPADKGTVLCKDMKAKPTTKDYRALVGSLIYTVHTRPDVATIVSSLSRFNDCAQTTHYQAALRVLKYLFHSREKSLRFKPVVKVGNELVVYSDSSWNTDPETSRSRSGYIVFFNQCPIAWKSHMQKLVTLSSCEAEYVALVDAAKEALWLKNLLADLEFQQSAVTIYVDNQSAIKLAKHSMVRPRTKHIHMRFHWLREQVQAGLINLVYVPTDKNVADMFTKNLGRIKLQTFLQQLLA